MGVSYSPPAENLYCTVAHPRIWGHGGAGFPGFDRPLSIDFVHGLVCFGSISGLDRARSSPNCLMLSMPRGSKHRDRRLYAHWGMGALKWATLLHVFAVYPTRTPGEAGGQQRPRFSERMRRSCSWKGAQRDGGSGTEVPRITATRGPGT